MSGFTWIGFSFVMSLAGIAASIACGATSSNGDIIPFVFLVVSGYWLYKTLMYWKAMLRVVDPRFDEAIKKVENEE